MKIIKILLLLCLAPIVLIGCLSANTKPAQSPETNTGGKLVQGNVTIKPSGSFEECIELRPGQVFDYEFDASDYVNFNIHYHSVTGLYYPVDKKGIGFGKGTLDPGTHPFYTAEQESYCLMWDNFNDGRVEVSYKCVLREK